MHAGARERLHTRIMVKKRTILADCPNLPYRTMIVFTSSSIIRKVSATFIVINTQSHELNTSLY